jgi:hypothetical protein
VVDCIETIEAPATRQIKHSVAVRSSAQQSSFQAIRFCFHDIGASRGARINRDFRIVGESRSVLLAATADTEPAHSRSSWSMPHHHELRENASTKIVAFWLAIR